MTFPTYMCVVDAVVTREHNFSNQILLRLFPCRLRLPQGFLFLKQSSSASANRYTIAANCFWLRCYEMVKKFTDARSNTHNFKYLPKHQVRHSNATTFNCFDTSVKAQFPGEKLVQGYLDELLPTIESNAPFHKKTTDAHTSSVTLGRCGLNDIHQTDIKCTKGYNCCTVMPI